VDFKAIKEPWNIYELADGTTLKTRFILTKVLVDGLDMAKSPVYSVNSQNVVGAFAREERLGEPSKRGYTPQERIDAIEEEVEFTTKKEEWNVYEFSDGTTARIKLVLTSVARTSLFDSNGEPIYLINAQPIFSGSIPKETRQKYAAELD